MVRWDEGGKLKAQTLHVRSSISFNSLAFKLGKGRSRPVHVSLFTKGHLPNCFGWDCVFLFIGVGFWGWIGAYLKKR